MSDDRIAGGAFSEMHHLVARGYQQNFSSNDKRVDVINPRTGAMIANGRPIKGNFVVRGYNTHRTSAGASDSRLEREFAKLEAPALDQIRRVSVDHCGPDQRAAVVSHCALHLVRSQAFHATHQRIVHQLRNDWGPRLACDPELRKRYAADFGCDASDQEIAGYIDGIIKDHIEANRLHVDSMVRQYNGLARFLSRYWIQVISSGRLGVGFAIGDIPVVHMDTRTSAYGFRDGLAVGDANLVIAPLTRWTAVAFSVERTPHVALTVKRRLHEVNAVFARAAMQEIACHPGDALEVSRACQAQDRLPAARLVRP